jgi:hypothetical protein
VFPRFEDSDAILVAFGDRGGSLDAITEDARRRFANWVQSERRGTDPAAVGPFDGAWLMLALSAAANVATIVAFLREWKGRGTPIHLGMGAAAALAREFLAEQGVIQAELETGAIRWHGFGAFITANLPDSQCTYTLFFRENKNRHRVVVTSTGEVLAYDRSQIDDERRINRTLF